MTPENQRILLKAYAEHELFSAQLWATHAHYDELAEMLKDLREDTTAAVLWFDRVIYGKAEFDGEKATATAKDLMEKISSIIDYLEEREERNARGLKGSAVSDEVLYKSKIFYDKVPFLFDCASARTFHRVMAASARDPRLNILHVIRSRLCDFYNFVGADLDFGHYL